MVANDLSWAVFGLVHLDAPVTSNARHAPDVLREAIFPRWSDAAPSAIAGRIAGPGQLAFFLVAAFLVVFFAVDFLAVDFFAAPLAGVPGIRLAAGVLGVLDRLLQRGQQVDDLAGGLGRGGASVFDPRRPRSWPAPTPATASA